MDSTTTTTTVSLTAGISNGVTDTCFGLLIVLVGPAGVGKNTIMQRVLAAVPRMQQMPTATTRAPRASEQHGREHWFVSPEAFQAMIAAGELLEYQEVYPGRFYGTPRHQIEQALTYDHAWLIADIDIAGAANLQAAFPHSAVLIFIAPPNIAALEARLRARGQASEAEIQERLARAPRELEFATQCDYRFVNDDLDRTAQTVIETIQAEAQRHQCA